MPIKNGLETFKELKKIYQAKNKLLSKELDVLKLPVTVIVTAWGNSKVK